MSASDMEKGSLPGRIGFVISTAIIVFIFVVVIWEVLSRYILDDSSMWVTEISGYLLAGALFAGLGRVYRIDGHVRMSVLMDSVSPKTANIFLLLSDAIVFVFAVILLWQTWSLTLDSYVLNWRSSTNLEVRLYLPQSLMTLGAAVFVIEIIFTALRRIQNINKN